MPWCSTEHSSMDKFKQKLKKDKTQQNCKEKIVADVKCIKENIKIREILRNVKMNSSMRLKAPTGSKVMDNTDFSDYEDCFENDLVDEDTPRDDPPCAMNHDLILSHSEFSSMPCDLNNVKTNLKFEKCRSNSEANLSTTLLDIVENRPNVNEVPTSVPEHFHTLPANCRNRKTSLDPTILNRKISQSELDLNSLGKSPLERKSTFFRKKMDSFLRNTSTFFRKQSGMPPYNNQSVGRTAESLQCLNENRFEGDDIFHNNQLKQVTPEVSRSAASLVSESTIGSTSSSSQFIDQPLNPSLGGSMSTLFTQNLKDSASNSAQSLNEAYIQEAMLTSRAISMNSGLDTTGNRRGRKSRANRVTWLASEGLTNYFRRVIQDEKSKEKIKSYHSNQDFLSIPENDMCALGTDTKGRRLSYQRAVSGEDPVQPLKHQDSTLRKRHQSSEKNETTELQNHLAEFSKSGVPSLQGFVVASIPETSFSYLMWADQSGNLEFIYNWKTLDENEQRKQAVVRELVATEANYIQHLMVIVEVFIAAAHSLQDSGKMLQLDTARLFSNIPDLLNANLIFWNLTFYPMVKDAVENNTPYNVDLMSEGFSRFPEIFQPYERYMADQSKMMLYLRLMQNDPEFSMYLNWCYSNKSCNRLQLADLLVKPMQRLTKYSLILRRVAAHAKSSEESVTLKTMENYVKCYVNDLNRSMRQREELEKIDDLASSIEPHELDFKDEEMEKAFKAYCALNLRTPMLNSSDLPLRNLLYECDLRFKDNIGKETEVKLFLLTDLMLICKKQSKGNSLPFKMIRPKIFLERLVPWQKSAKSPSQNSLVYIILDDCNSATGCFTLSESSKDPMPAQTLKTLELKIKEARMSHAMYVWAAMNPSRDLSEMEASESGVKLKTPEDMAIENEARERVACMFHRGLGVSTDECSQSFTTDSNETAGEGPTYNRMGAQRQYVHRLSTASSRQSRLSSFQQSLSATSRDEPQAGSSKTIYRASTSFDQPVTSITVNVVNENEAATPLDPLVADGLTVHVTPAPESPHSLSPHPQNNVSVLRSHPDLRPETITLSFSSPGPSASERLYQSHQELLQRNRLAASQYLTPDHRGSSYPPPSPTRASLKRGLAFSYSFKNPPLSKMGNVYSQSQLDAAMYASQQLDRQPSPSLSEKSDKKNKILGNRNKAASSTDPEESAASSSVPTRHTSVQENTDIAIERPRSADDVE
ncbi:unnamed protein product [Leptosia nina]|uniref:DH domain-containing protein n=1 Tax=Leptosia nina TaxID=320188 RepID=A0AAV1JXB5_9NEOP